MMPDHQLWIGTWDQGLAIFDPQTQRFKQYKNDLADPHSLSHNTVRVIYQDRRGITWVGSYGGLNQAVYQGESLRFKAYTHQASQKNSLSHNFVQAILEDKQGRLWVGTQEGINLFNRGSGTFLNYRTRQSRLKVFTHDYIYCLAETPDGHLMAGTKHNGFYIYDYEHNHLRQYNEQSGLVGNTVLTIIPLENHQYWISTTDGLSFFDERSGKFKNYRPIDGLSSKEFYPRSGTRLPDGRLAFGNIQGLTLFHPDSIRENSLSTPGAYQPGESTGSVSSTYSGKSFASVVRCIDDYF
ncbi:MAG: hypothetical protein HC880_01165 [Bacteroidia bacterium]|nr:hypothetical protein [Bacteroidia bacterium]